MILSNDGLVAFHYRSYGTFFLQQNRLHNIHRDLPTTNIIEPEKLETMRFIVGRFTSFSPEVEFWPSLFKLYVILNSE